MRTNSKLLVLVAALLTIAALIWSSVSIQASQKKYEIRPEIILPQYGIGTGRTIDPYTIDPYERSMERYILQTEENLDIINTNLQGIFEKLDSIDAGLNDLSSRIKRIEKTLGTRRPEKSTTRQRQYREQEDIYYPAPKRPRRNDCPHRDTNY